MNDRPTMCPEGHQIEWSQWQANGASYGGCGGEGCPTTWKWEDGDLFPTPGSGETWLRKEVRRLRAALAQTTTERDELQETFDLRWRADQRAIASWHEQHPGHDRIWPDHADLVVWLGEQFDKTESAVAKLTKERDVANLACDLSEKTDLHAQVAATWKERAERAEAACAALLVFIRKTKTYWRSYVNGTYADSITSDDNPGAALLSVVEAARAWRRSKSSPYFRPSIEACDALIAAVDALDAPTGASE